MMTKTEKKEKIKKIGIHLEEDLLDEVLDKARSVFKHEHVYYYTEAVRRVLLFFLRTNPMKYE